MSPSDHADLEALSAYVDGEAPEWADHVAGCEVCRGTAAVLRAVTAAVGRPVEAPAPAVREAALAAALDALPAPVAAGARAPSRLAPDRHEAERARFAGRRSPRPWAMPAVAAVVVGLLGLSGVILSSYRSSDDLTTVAGPALESDKAGGRESLAGAPQAPVTDLGDVGDAATLRARAQLAAPVAATSGSTGRATSSSSSGAASDAGATNSGATGAPNATSGASGAPAVLGAPSAAAGSSGAGGAATVVGTRPCEEQARTRQPSLGPVVFFATARRGTVEGYVLGFTPVGASLPVTLLLLAQDGCRELLRAAGP